MKRSYIDEQDKARGPFLSAIKVLFDQVEKAQTNIAAGRFEDPILDLKEYVRVRIALSRAFSTMTVTARDELVSLMDQLDWTVNAVETIRFRSLHGR